MQATVTFRGSDLLQGAGISELSEMLGGSGLLRRSFNYVTNMGYSEF